MMPHYPSRHCDDKTNRHRSHVHVVDGVAYGCGGIDSDTLVYPELARTVAAPVTAPRSVSCPACYARAEEPCTVPTETGRRDVAWLHLSRIDAACELERRDVVDPAELVGVRELAQLHGVKPSTIVSWSTRHDGFPPPVVELASGRVWSRVQVQAWVDARASETAESAKRAEVRRAAETAYTYD